MTKAETKNSEATTSQDDENGQESEKAPATEKKAPAAKKAKVKKVDPNKTSKFLVVRSGMHGTDGKEVPIGEVLKLTETRAKALAGKVVPEGAEANMTLAEQSVADKARIAELEKQLKAAQKKK